MSVEILPTEKHMGTLKTRDWKTRDHIAGVEFTGLKNAGPNFQGGKRTTTVY